MTTITLPMPRLGETMEQGTIASWLVEPGDSFKRGDPLLELETDKTLVEYPALGSGTLTKTLVAPGDVVDVGSPIAVIESDEAWMLPEVSAAEQEVSTTQETQGAKRVVAPAAVGNNIRATPVARKRAKQANIALSELQGTGRRGRIELHDVIAASSQDSRASGQRSQQYAPKSAEGGFLLVHGFAGDSSSWTALAASLRRAGHKVTTVDLPGHGKNNAPANHPDDLVTWLADYLSKLTQSVHLVGHSLGGYVAVSATVYAPDNVAQLTLITPAGCGHQINGSFVAGMAVAQSVGEVSHLLRLLGPTAAALPAETISEISSELAAGRLKALASTMARGDTQCIDTISAIASLPDNLPVSALFGVADTIIPKEHVFNMPPRVAVHVLRAGHLPHWDTPMQVERLLS